MRGPCDIPVTMSIQALQNKGLECKGDTEAISFGAVDESRTWSEISFMKRMCAYVCECACSTRDHAMSIHIQNFEFNR